MFNYQSGYPPPKQQQYGAYPPTQEQPQQTRGYQPTLPSASFFNTDQEVSYEKDISRDYDKTLVHKPYHYKLTKPVKLVNGNYVVDCLVSSKLLSIVPK